MAQMLAFSGFLAVLLRAAILCFQTVVIGGLFFFIVVARGPQSRDEAFLRSGWKLVRWSALGLALSQVFFLVTNSVALTYSTDIPLGQVFNANFFWAGLVAAASGFAVALWPVGLRQSVNPVVLFPAALILAASVMTSHSASRMEERALLVGLTALHYLATATWIGGLPYLLLAMKRIQDNEVRSRVMQRFSRLAQASVAVLLLAGLGMAWVLVGSWDAMYGTAYGVMLSAKVSMLAALLLLGAANFYIVRGLPRGSGSGATSLVRFAEAEIGIGLAVILTAASMTSQPPGVDLNEDRLTLEEIAARYAPRMPRFSSPPLNEISESTEELIKRAEAQGKPVPTSFVPGQWDIDFNKWADKAWSEYNHNCAGFVVFLLGILALLSRSRYFRWARIWPLAFLLLAVFLFFRADPENWPLGPNGFWESFQQTDVLQHRAAVLLIIVFAVFQYRVEMKWVKSMTAALVFPVVCMLGGMVLLTHTHALSNVKEELLVDLSHTPLAVLAVYAGWSRWLELRLPEDNGTRNYVAWVWPVCFILIGLLLMDYHEM
jgi:putative copper resistance protein D